MEKNGKTRKIKESQMKKKQIQMKKALRDLTGLDISDELFLFNEKIWEKMRKQKKLKKVK